MTDEELKKLRRRENRKRYRQRHPERVKASNAAYSKSTRNNMTKNWTKRLRHAVLQGYSQDGVPQCNCCGEKTVVFLTIDHVNGGGNQERKTGLVGGSFYKKIIDEGLPPTYQILCHNCNMGKHLLGECPHKLMEPE